MTKFTLLAAVAAGALVPFSAGAQDHGGHHGHAPSPQPTPAPTSAGPTHSQHRDHAPAQDAPAKPVDHSTMDHSNMDHRVMDHGEDSHGRHRASDVPGTGSGTARLPATEGAMHGVHLSTGDWMGMAHGYATTAYTKATGPRGDDHLFVQTMGMLTGETDLGGARLQLKSMFSLEPLMGARGYPNLFATGETAGGEKLVDRQHPHDLFMELAARIDVPVGADATAFLYGGPVGEPALGPSAFMHRGSARNLPLSPITHHWFDSTHITYGVVTAGVANRQFQIEASAFRGREPDEERWDIETPKLDSWSVRATWNPRPNWSAQVSHGRLKSPEVLHPDEDEARTTASIHYSDERLRTTFAFANKNRLPGDSLTAWLGEANYDITPRHAVFGRVENVANDELFDHHDALGDRTFRVTKFEGGYAWNAPIAGPVGLALGGSLAAYAKPSALDAAYGDDPVQWTLFARLSVGH